MRSWLFHPIIFYPLALLIAAAAILISLEPQARPRDPAPIEVERTEGALVLRGDAFNAPSPSDDQHVTVVRDWLGRPQSLRIAVLPNLAPPTTAETGVQILLSPPDAAELAGRPVTVEVSYNPSPVNAANALGVSLRGAADAPWVVHEIRPQPATVRFELPAQTEVNAIGLRAVHGEADAAFGLEITRIRLIPHA
jgi:hypothetical protein